MDTATQYLPLSRLMLWAVMVVAINSRLRRRCRRLALIADISGLTGLSGSA